MLAVDPGIRGCGVALFEGPTLVACAYVFNKAKEGNRAAEAADMARAIGVEFVMGRVIDELVVEWPRVYATRLRKGEMDGQDPNDLIALSAIDGALAYRMGVKTTSYVPSEWKGQMKKEPCHARIKSRLNPRELAILMDADNDAKSKAHNVYDAVGIGLHHLGRLKPVRVIPA